MRLTFSTQAWNEYIYWQTQDRKTLNKKTDFYFLLLVMEQHLVKENQKN